MKQLVKLYKRPSRDGQRFTFFLRYDGENGKQKWETLGHGDRRKAERQCAQKEKELRMGYIEHGSMRRGELLNLVWSDVDFEEQTITVSSKNDTKHTWKWLIKDSDHRVLPLTSEITQLLVEHQESQSEGTLMYSCQVKGMTTCRKLSGLLGSGRYRIRGPVSSTISTGSLGPYEKGHVP